MSPGSKNFISFLYMNWSLSGFYRLVALAIRFGWFSGLYSRLSLVTFIASNGNLAESGGG